MHCTASTNQCPGRSASLGPEHPATFASLQNHAATLQALGDNAAARAAFERALEAGNRLLGPEHPDTRVTRYNLLLTLLRIDPEAARPHLVALQTLRTIDPARLSSTDRHILAALDELAARLAAISP